MDLTIHQKLSSLSLLSQAKLESVMYECGAKKDLIIDPQLIKPLEHICGVQWLRQQGIDKIYKMEPNLNVTSSANRIYLIPACTKKFKCVLDHISSAILLKESLNEKEKFFHIIITPKVHSTYNSMVESRGLSDIVTLYSYSWDFLLLDEGILSLELGSVFSKSYVEHNYEYLSSVAMSLWGLTHIVGKPDVIFSFGKLSSKVVDMMEMYEETFESNLSVNHNKDIGAIIIIDRDQDLTSSLLTPVTYSALLHESFTLNCGNLTVNPSETKHKKGRIFHKVEEGSPKTNTANILLDSSSDLIYKEVKYRHFSEVLGILCAKAKQLRSEDYKNKDIQAMKKFVASKLPQITAFKQILVNHILACETIVTEMSDKFEVLKNTESDMINNRNKKSCFTYLDEVFSTDIHKFNSLRLMCLMSLTQGFTYEEYNSLVSKYLQAFGHKYLYVFENLVNSGLLIRPSSLKINLNLQNIKNISDKLPRWQNDFQIFANKFKLLPNECESTQRSHCSYVFNGCYVPLIAAICNIILLSENLSDCITKLSSLNDIKIGGEILEKLKASENLDQALNRSINDASDLDYGCIDVKKMLAVLKNSANFGNVIPLRPKCILIHIIGGVTYAEIAACNVIELATGSQIIITSDSIVTGSELMLAAM